MLLVALLAFSGCATVPPAGQATHFAHPAGAALPARIVSNFFVVESRGDDGQPYRFLIDTGSTATLVSPGLAQAVALKRPRGAPPAKVRLRSASGGELELDPVTLRRLILGDVAFERVPALVYDLSSLSDHLGLRIDAIVGFPVFRDLLLTMDYPGGQLRLAPLPAQPPLADPGPRASTIPFNNEQNTPLIPIQMGNESFIVQVDTGSDGGLSLNPTGLHPRFVNGPRPGTLISSVQGDRQQLTGRSALDVRVGTQTIAQPVIDLTDQLSSIGGEFLRHFSVTFDQRDRLVTLVSDTDGPVKIESRRSTGLSFARSPVYWKVLSIIPDTPTAQLPVQAGDLCIRINGEPVAKWTFDRYAALMKSASTITYTFLNGTKEADLEIPVFRLVP